VDRPVITIGSFCTGVGLLDVAAKLAFEHLGYRTKSVFVCEWDAFAAEVLRSRMEDSSLEPAPIWCGDLRDFPAEDFHGLVDAVVAGFPCQDISCAGKQVGIQGARSGLFFDILDAAVRMGAEWLLLENVAAITSNGMDTVLGTLTESGFSAEWMCLTASAVGASHRRNRWFCVANRADS
jgi:DNA (cytosine-5)-methyltransferase 1